jgi:hypothetical protein
LYIFIRFFQSHEKLKNDVKQILSNTRALYI